MGKSILEMSTVTEEGIADVKTKACEELLQDRVNHKFKSNKVETIMNRLTVAIPRPGTQRPDPHLSQKLRSRRDKKRCREVWLRTRKRWRPRYRRGRQNGRLNWSREMITLWISRRTMTFLMTRSMISFPRRGRATTLQTSLILT